MGQPDSLLCLHAVHARKGSPHGCEKGNISAVMDGDLDDFITAYLKALSQVRSARTSNKFRFCKFGAASFAGRCFFLQNFCRDICFLRKKTFLFSDKCGKLNHGIAQNDLCVPYGSGQNFYYTLAEPTADSRFKTHEREKRSPTHNACDR